MTLLLVAHSHPTVAVDFKHPNLGRLMGPRLLSSIRATSESGIKWAADNDCFNGLDAGAYYAMLDLLPQRGCLFVTVPDVVGDAVATAHRFEAWSIGVERRGLPMALVLQDGIENLLDWYGYHFHRLAAVFIGGTTHWKMGPAARALAIHAHDHGRWVHWGRINTHRRLTYCKSTGTCDSFDGTKWAKWRDVHLRHGLEHASAPTQLPLT